MYYYLKSCKNLSKLFKLIVFMLSTMAISGCGRSSEEEIVDFSGAYKLLHNGGKGSLTDTISEDISELKIYTEGYYIYAQRDVLDSVSSFEIGKYGLNDDKLEQHIIFSSYGSIKQEPTNSTFQIKKTGEDVIEISKNPNTELNNNSANLERLKFIGKGEKSRSVIDGVWRQIRTYTVADNDTIWDKGTNYKIMYDGYFVWGDFHIDPATQEYDTFFGLGTYEMKGNSKVVEKLIKSNWASSQGTTFQIDIEFKDGNNEYKQTIADSNTGVRYIEVYQRLDNCNR